MAVSDWPTRRRDEFMQAPGMADETVDDNHLGRFCKRRASKTPPMTGDAPKTCTEAGNRRHPCRACAGGPDAHQEASSAPQDGDAARSLIAMRCMTQRCAPRQ